MSQLVIDSSIQQQMYKLGEYETCLYRSGQQKNDKDPLFTRFRAGGIFSGQLALCARGVWGAFRLFSTGLNRFWQ